MARQTLLIAFCLTLVAVLTLADQTSEASSPGSNATAGNFTPSPDFAKTKYNWVDLKKCCPLPELLSEVSKSTCKKQRKESAGTTVDPASEEAASEGEEGGLKTAKRDRGCWAECNFKELGLLGPDGKVNAELVEKHAVTVEEREIQWRGLITAAVKTCASQPPSSKLGKQCTSGAAELKSCMANQMSITCPAPVRVESQLCTDIRAKKTLQTSKKTERAMKRLLG